ADSQDPKGTFVCFLEPDLTAGEFKGVNSARSNFGRFMMFRTRNETGTGTGQGQVAIPSFPPGPLNISSGSVGFSRIVLGQGTPLPPRPYTFEHDVYHWFKDKTCSNDCHKPGGIGYMQAPERFDCAMVNKYRADWSAAVDDVYNALLNPCQTGCDQLMPPAR